jgi:uncharacterized protein YndB with AHSA1/START domain
VRWSQQAAFRRFTAEISKWWPMRTHSVGEDRTRSVVFEDHVGGRIYEVDEGGETHTWGTILTWEPPTRLRFTWHPGQDPDLAQEIEVVFVAVGEGTRLELTHRGWEKLGKRARFARRGYNLGWAHVLDIWANHIGARVLIMNALMKTMQFASRFRAGRHATATTNGR